MKTIKGCEEAAIELFDEARYFDDDFGNLRCVTTSWEGDAQGEITDWRGDVFFKMGNLAGGNTFRVKMGLNDDGDLSIYNGSYEYEVGNDTNAVWVYTLVTVSDWLGEAETRISELEDELNDLQADAE